MVQSYQLGSYSEGTRTVAQSIYSIFLSTAWSFIPLSPHPAKESVQIDVPTVEATRDNQCSSDNILSSHCLIGETARR